MDLVTFYSSKADTWDLLSSVRKPDPHRALEWGEKAYTPFGEDCAWYGYFAALVGGTWYKTQTVAFNRTAIGRDIQKAYLTQDHIQRWSRVFYKEMKRRTMEFGQSAHCEIFAATVGKALEREKVIECGEMEPDLHIGIPFNWTCTPGLVTEQYIEGEKEKIGKVYKRSESGMRPEITDDKGSDSGSKEMLSLSNVGAMIHPAKS